MDILETFPEYAFECKGDDIFKYFQGYKNYDKIYYNHNTIICSESCLHYIDNNFSEFSNKQIILIVDNTIDMPVYICKRSGLDYYNHLKRIINKYYNFEEELSRYTEEYDYSKSQLHYVANEFDGLENNTLYDIDNAYYYDLNGAYCKELCNMFPKAGQDLTNLYVKSRFDSNLKSVYCFATGYIQHKGFSGAYNHIVQSVRKKIDDAIDNTQGDLLYANTDGFIVYNSLVPLKVSHELGEFKLEYKGPVLFYRNTNSPSPYYVIEFNDGSKKTDCRMLTRKYLNLKDKKIVNYKIYKKYIKYDLNSQGNHIYKSDDSYQAIKNIEIQEIKENAKKI